MCGKHHFTHIMYTNCLLLIWFLPLFVGCQPAAAPAPKVNKKPPPAAKLPTPPKPVPVPETKQLPPEPEPPKFVDDPSQRILLFTPQGPFVVQLRIEVAGAPFAELRQTVVEELIRLADTDNDGKTTWEEALNSPWFGTNQRGGSNEEKQRLIKIYDRNHNDLLEPHEAARYAEVTDGVGAVFRLEDDLGRDDESVSQTAVWRLLDTEQDGILSPEEMAAATQRLKLRDADDNDLLLLAELDDSQAFAQGTPGMATPNTAANSGPPRAVLLGPRAPWDSIALAWEQLYLDNNQLQADKFPLARRIQLALDKNKDGWLNRQELTGLNTLSAHVVLRVSFGKSPQTQPVEMVEASDDWDSKTQSVEQLSTGEVKLKFPSLQMAFTVRDPTNAGDLEELAKTQFDQLDADKNAYLDGDELASFEAMPGYLEMIDRDNDGKVYEAEVLAWLKRSNLLTGSSISALSSDGGDSTLGLLDLDGDGRLGWREILQASHTLLKHDADDDGYLLSSEVARPLHLVFRRQTSSMNPGAPTPATMATTATSSNRPGPPWFVRMDANGDGDISSREFLGTIAQFQQLDTNGDGLIDLAEAEAFSEPE